jgi:hypothetical protein
MFILVSLVTCVILDVFLGSIDVDCEKIMEESWADIV